MYDPTKTYPNTGERGNSTIQSVEMEIDKTGLEHYPGLTTRFRITISPTLAQVRELIRVMPEAFDGAE